MPIDPKDFNEFATFCQENYRPPNEWRDVPEDMARLFRAAPAMYELLKEIEFVESNGVRFCPSCNNCWGLPRHDDDCKLAAVIAEVEGK